MMKAWVFLFVVSLAPASFASTVSKHSCSPLSVDDGAKISVAGRLKKEMHWGPPNFGESPHTDSKFAAWIIVRTNKLKIANGRDVTEIQVRPDQDIDLSKMDGQVVLATGDLWIARAPSDVTPVILSASRIVTYKDASYISCMKSE